MNKNKGQGIGLTFKKQFKGLFHNCGKQGHTKNYCWYLESKKHIILDNWEVGTKIQKTTPYYKCVICKKTTIKRKIVILEI